MSCYESLTSHRFVPVAFRLWPMKRFERSSSDTVVVISKLAAQRPPWKTCSLKWCETLRPGRDDERDSRKNQLAVETSLTCCRECPITLGQILSDFHFSNL